ncbi:MAG: DUF5615 family PIN-like protein [Fimbriimonadia bacterium]|nr:DUF5615 family PIN-like protein [Fimbriimonadia bacterium]
MHLKLDENLGNSQAQLLRDAGYDVETVYSQGMTSASDRDLIEACKSEARCLVTLDMDFANPLLFKPSEYNGIAVLRLPPKSSIDDLRELIELFLEGMQQYPIRGQLWILQRGKIRVYQEE